MALKDIIVATQTDLRANPDNAAAMFSADSRQVGACKRTKIRQFSAAIDEPRISAERTPDRTRRACPMRLPHARRSLTAPMLPRWASRSKASRSNSKVH